MSVCLQEPRGLGGKSWHRTREDAAALVLHPPAALRVNAFCGPRSHVDTHCGARLGEPRCFLPDAVPARSGCATYPSRDPPLSSLRASGQDLDLYGCQDDTTTCQVEVPQARSSSPCCPCAPHPSALGRERCAVGW